MRVLNLVNVLGPSSVCVDEGALPCGHFEEGYTGSYIICDFNFLIFTGWIMVYNIMTDMLFSLILFRIVFCNNLQMREKPILQLWNSVAVRIEFVSVGIIVIIIIILVHGTCCASYFVNGD